MVVARASTRMKLGRVSTKVPELRRNRFAGQSPDESKDDRGATSSTLLLLLHTREYFVNIFDAGPSGGFDGDSVVDRPKLTMLRGEGTRVDLLSTKPLCSHGRCRFSRIPPYHTLPRSKAGHWKFSKNDSASESSERQTRFRVNTQRSFGLRWSVVKKWSSRADWLLCHPYCGA